MKDYLFNTKLRKHSRVLNPWKNGAGRYVRTITMVATLLLTSFTAFSQNNVGINTTGNPPDPSAMLDVSSTEQGVLIPRLTDAQRQALKDPATGLIIYNTDSNELNFYNGSGWQDIETISVSGTSAGGTGPGNGVSINTSGNAPDPSAILDVSSTDKGVLLPRTTQGAVTAVTGLMIYNTTTNKMNFYDGSTWQELCAQTIDNNTGTGATGGGVSINPTGAKPDSSAILDVESSSKGLLIPRMTASQRNAIQSPSEGLMIYNNTNNRIEHWTGSAWHKWVYQPPSQPSAISGSDTVCQGDAGEIYSVTNVSGVTYTWSYSGSGFTIVSGQGSDSITADYSGGSTSDTLTVIPSNACGSGTAQTLFITVEDTATAPSSVSASPNPVCNGNSTTLSYSGGSGSTFEWYTGSCGGTSVGSGQNLSVSPSSTTTYYGRWEHSCGNSSCQSVTVTVEGAGFSSCGDSITFTYREASVTYGTVTGDAGKCWLDRNLGASQVATSSTDNSSYGDLFQWGRLDDDHQDRTSGQTTTLSGSDVPGHSDFITNGSSPYDWRSPQNDNLWQGVSGTNNPCPCGWRLPTETEWVNESSGWSNNSDAYASPLKVPMAGYRDNSDGSLGSVGANGYYWSSTVDGTSSRYLNFGTVSVQVYSGNRARGHSVRCIKD